MRSLLHHCQCLYQCAIFFSLHFKTLKLRFSGLTDWKGKHLYHCGRTIHILHVCNDMHPSRALNILLKGTVRCGVYHSLPILNNRKTIVHGIYSLFTIYIEISFSPFDMMKEIRYTQLGSSVMIWVNASPHQ